MKDCDPELMQKGALVMTTHTIKSTDIEAWVQSVAKLSEQKLDWHYVGGRACILATGDISRVYAAIREFLPEHNRLQVAAASEYIGCENFEPDYRIYDKNEINTVYEGIVRK